MIARWGIGLCVVASSGLWVTVAEAVCTGVKVHSAQAAVTSGAGDNNGYELNISNATVQDGANATDGNSGFGDNSVCFNSGSDQHTFYNYDFSSIPAGATINGIVVQVRTSVNSAASSPQNCVRLSYDGGSSWTAFKTTPALSTTLTTYRLGGAIDAGDAANDTWGRTWSVAELTTASNFRLGISDIEQDAASNSKDFRLDYLDVNACYTPNQAPTFSVSPDDGSTSASPTNEGTNVTFTTTATDPEGNQYKLLVCKANDQSGGACGAGGTWCTSALANSGSQASCTYTASSADAPSQAWYAWVCDSFNACTAASPNPPAASPFYVNRAPSFSSLGTSAPSVASGSAITFTTTASDPDAGDSVKLFVCTTNSAGSAGCTSGTWCSSGLVASNPSCSYTTTCNDARQANSYYGFIFDSHNLASASNSRTGTFNVNQTVYGNAYADEASTVWAGCNGSTQNISLVINGGAAATTSCASGTGAFCLGSLTLAANNPVSVFFNATDKGAAATVAADATSNIVLNPRKNIVWLTTEGAVASITNANLSHCSSASPAQCANVPYSSGNASWYNASWLYRQKLTVQSSKVPNTSQTNFPVYVNLANVSAGFFTHVKSDGSDIVVTSSDGVTKLSRQLVAINTAGSTGELWFKAPTLSTSANTNFYIYYGNASAAETNDAATWDTSFKGVWHLQETTGGAGAIKDSTSNANNGTDTNSPTLGAAGQIGNAISFNGTNNYVDMGIPASLQIAGAVTLSFWMNTTTGAVTDPGVAGTAPSGSVGNGYLITNHNGTTIWWYIQGGGNNANFSGLTQSAWHHIVGTWDGTTGTNGMNLYKDGVLTAQHTSTQSSMSAWPSFKLGNATSYYKGLIDEVRVSNTNRSADWISTEYNNQSSPSTFYSVGAEEVSSNFVNATTGENTVEFHVASGKTYAPGGNLTLSPGGSSGDLHLVGTLTAGTNPISIGGSWNNAGTFSKSSGQTTTFTATATGKTITPGGSNFGAVTFNGASGGWTSQANMTLDGNLTVTAGTFEVGTTTVQAPNVTVNGGTLSMTGSGGVLKISGSGTLSMSSGTITTAQAASAPQLTTADTVTPTYAGVSITGGTLNIAQLVTSYLKNTGFVIGSGVTLTTFDNATWSSTNQTTAGTDVMLDITAQTATLRSHTFPASWTSGEYNVRLNTSGTITMQCATGAFSGPTNKCDSGNSCASGTGLINWPCAQTTIEKATVENATIN